MLVTISGIDGAGKSTQLALLREELERRGRRSEILWHRPGYSPRMDRARALIRRLRPGALPGADRPAERAAAFARPEIARAWLLAAGADTLVEYGVRVRLALARGRDVLCDRYLIDARLDLDLRFPERADEIAWLFSTLERLCPRPDVQLLLSVSAEARRRRNLAAPEPFPDPPELRESRHRRYQILAETGAFAVIDAGGEIDEVFRAVLARIDEAGA